MATKQKWTNLASSTLAAPITGADTVLDIQSGAGSKFPDTSDGFFTIRITDGAGNYEFIDVITRSTDTFDDLVRESEEAARFPARSWSAGASVSLVGTSKKTLERFAQKDEEADITAPWHFLGGATFGGGSNAWIPGMVGMWLTDVCPSGFLFLDGQIYNIVDYPDLAAALGSFQEGGDGVDTFGVPNFGGRSPMGAGTGSLTETVAASDVNTTDDTFLVADNSATWITGMAIELTTDGTLSTGVALLTTYYIIRNGSTTVKFATSLANAVAGTAVNISAQGSGTHTINHTLSARVVGEMLGQESHVQTPDEMPLHGHPWRASYTNQTSFRSFTTGGMPTSTNSEATQTAYTGSPSGAQGQQIGGSGGGAQFNLISPKRVANFIIKT